MVPKYIANTVKRLTQVKDPQIKIEGTRNNLKVYWTGGNKESEPK